MKCANRRMFRLHLMTAEIPQTAGNQSQERRDPTFLVTCVVILFVHVAIVLGLLRFNHNRTDDATGSEIAKMPIGAVATPSPASSGPAVAAPDRVERASTAAPVRQSPPRGTTPRTYTMVKGDNPLAIARRFSVDYQALLRINKITDPRRLPIGRKLILPEDKAPVLESDRPVIESIPPEGFDDLGDDSPNRR